MKILKLFAITFIFGFFFSSCDVVNPPYEEKPNGTVDTTSKVVLLEEYTGFRCGNCPVAGEVAHAIKEKYPDNVVLLSIHAGNLATPTPEHKYNFISQPMKDLDNYFDIGWGVGTPNGLVDRTPYLNNLILSQADWESAVLERLKNPGTIKIELTPSYSQTTKTINCTAKLSFLANGLASYNLALYVVEDSIVQYQTDYRKDPINIEDFVHNNILRAAMTPTFGEPIKDSAPNKGDVITKQYSLDIPATADWRPQWIRIVAVVTDNDNGYEVIQAGEKYLLK